MSDAEKTAVAAHLYVTLRRNANRVIDVEWMGKNEEYAKEILRLCRSLGFDDLTKYADRYEELMLSKPAAAPLPPPVAAPAPAAPETSASAAEPSLPPMFDQFSESSSSSEGETSDSSGSDSKYIGHLR
jgi:hypothetical protein